MNDFASGQLFDNRYEIIEVAGTGSFATVLKVKDKKLDIIKAIKVFDKVEQDSFVGLQNEARNLAKINHPNVIKIFDFAQTEDFYYLDLEFVEGKLLSEMTGILSEHEVIDYALQMAEGLQEIHNNDIIHHDIKPENILLTNDNKIKISDFGISNKISQKIQSDEVYGSIAYCAPEKIAKEEIDIRSDIFSFGVTLYELLFAELPFAIKNKKPVYDLPKELNKEKSRLEKVISKCIETDPENRYNDFLELIKDLQDVQKPPETKSTGFFKDKNTLKTIIAVIILLALLLPAYTYFLMKLFHGESKVNFVSNQQSLYKNYDRIADSDGEYNFVNGDLIQIKNSDGNIIYQFEYDGEKIIDITTSENRIFNDGKVVGQIIEKKSDLTLLEEVDFIKTKIPLQNSFLAGRDSLTIHFEGDFSNEELALAANNLKAIIISKNNNNLDLSFLDDNKNIQSVSIIESKIKQQIKSDINSGVKNLEIDSPLVYDLQFISTLTQIEQLKIENTQITSLSDISNLNNLKNLSLQKNRKLDDFSTIKKMTSLQKIESDDEEIIDSNSAKSLGRKDFNTWLKITLFSLLLAILFLLLIYLLQKKSTNEPQKENTEEKRAESIDNSVIDEIKKEIDVAVSKHHFSLPEAESALYILQSKKKELVRAGEYKNLHANLLKDFYIYIDKRMEDRIYEPAILEIIEAEKYFKNSRLKKYKKKLTKRMRHIAPIKLKHIKGNKYHMGDFSQKTQRIARPLHLVKVDDFYLSETLVTNKQFCEFLNSVESSKIDSYFKIENSKIRKVKNNFVSEIPYESHPVYNVSWVGAYKFCQWFGGRLPTEAEWEFAARNRGKGWLYATGKGISKKVANFILDENDTDWHSVKSVKHYPANPLGLYDMSGNLLEWCVDDYDKDFYYNSPMENPIAQNGGELKIIRGGAWCFMKENTMTFFRGYSKASAKTNFIGFRVAKSVS